MRKYIKEILSLLGEDRKKLPRLILMFLGGSLLDLAGLSLIGPYIALVVDPEAIEGMPSRIIGFFGLSSEQDSLLITIGIGLVVIFLIKTVSSLWINYKIIGFSQDQMVRLRSFLMRSYQNMDYVDYLRRNSAEYIHIIQNLTTQFASGVVLAGLRTLSDGIVAIVVLLMLIYQNPWALMLLIALLGSVVLGYDKLFRYRLHGYGLRANEASTSIVQNIHEGIDGFKEIRVLGKEAHFYRKVCDGAQLHSCNQTRYLILSSAPRYLLELSIVCFIVLLVVGALELEHNLQTLIPTLGIFGVASMRLMPIANGITSSLTQLRYARDAVSRLYKDIEMMKEKDKVKVANTFVKQEFNELELQNVSFYYPYTTRIALNKVSLKIKSGESIGLIGPSGSGKTTLVDVLLGLLVPQSGQIYFNGKPLNENLYGFQSLVAYLPQQVFLIDDTLRSNVALGIDHENIDDEHLYESLRKSRLMGLVEQLPKGVNTMLGERGVRLSGGQRQRVSLARAFYHERDVLVLDEATSALDNEIEQEIVDEIKRLKGQKTMIVIAHRLATVQGCDRIYRLENGCIIESGSPAAMLLAT